VVTLFAAPPNVGLAAILATDLIDYGKRKYDRAWQCNLAGS
jgi:hypothetical protein